MRIPSRWFIIVSAVLVTFLALVANVFAIQLESPAAGLSSSNATALPVPRPGPALEAEHTRSFDVVTHVRRNGSVRVQETIVQDFGSTARHGIEREIPLRDDLGTHLISHLVVSTSEGTPDDVSISASTDRARIRIGDADRTITGAHAYRLAYDLGNMTDRLSRGRSRIAIDAISAWRQSIDTLHYTVIGPAPPKTFRCQQGSLGLDAPCGSATRIERGATFTGTDMLAGSAFTVRLTWPDTVVAVSASDSTLEPGDVLYALLAGLSVGFVGWRYRRRWRRLFAAAQSQLWSTFGPDVAGQQTEAYDLTADPAIEFVPPMRLRPGEIGTLVEAEKTKLLTATVVDLAARGVLKITETAGSWTLERRTHDASLTADEQAVVDGLFGDAEVTTLDDRGAEMGTLAAALAETLTDDLEERGLAVQGTHAGGLHARARPWQILGVGVGAVLVGLAVHAIIVTVSGSRTTALVAEAALVTLVILGVGAILVGRAARGLTPTGLAAVWRVRGFDRFFTESEAMHDRAAADRGLFRQYMGYAIVFGHVTQWVAAFGAPDTSDWFVTTSPLDHAFIGFTAASLWSPPATSSSGFGGGGGGAGGGSGGGGGGSW